ncbi:MAG: hypothetical protein GY841_16985 [FCB group bacterium]|nr:hypothetical protein [FCB group bacterium]
MNLHRCILILFLLVAGGLSSAQNSSTAPLITPYTNEISFYRNVDDFGIDRGQTLQIISINALHLGTDFVFEFTGDFNWGLTTAPDKNYDHYMELSLVKPVYKSLSLNCQRIYGSLEEKPINQFGIRLAFFTN